jgi:urease accessory protein
MIVPAMALALLQYGDSAFPAGGFAFSWGVEGLAADGLLESADDLEDVVQEQLAHRWNSMDRLLLRRAFGAQALDEVATIDRLAEAATPSAQMREGSRRAGRALLGVSARLGHVGAIRYREAIARDGRLGHLPVAQGLAYREAGLSIEAAELLAGWTLIAALASAAVRLGIIGHIEAQHVMTRSRRALEALLAQAPAADARPSSFTPLTDIALSRNSVRGVRMFAT